MSNIAVIGGGASGMTAAIASANKGMAVTILEKNLRLGKKILSTGNGRCNFTNINASGDSYNDDIVSEAFKSFSPKDAIAFFEKLGVLTKVESDGRAYPNSGQASSVLDILRYELERLGVKTVTEFDVCDVKKIKNGFEITSKSGTKIFADKIIVATGGMAAPKTGSNGGGYNILKKLGHSITPLTPALCALKTDRGIQGVRQYGRVTLDSGETRIGEIQFASNAISGIPVFGLARYAKVGDSIFVDLLPDYTLNDIMKMLKNRPAQPLESYLVGILNKTLGQMLLKECRIGALSRDSGTLSDAEIEIIADRLKNWEFKITGLSEWDNAQVTAGGVKMSEINPKTMESKITSGLYIAGEVLDIDGDCGGYNLQWAWSSGYIAGGAASVQD